MTKKLNSREIAERIVNSADSVAYLADSMGKTSLPEAWRYGPSFEVRIRFDPRLTEIDDADLACRLHALQIRGPLRLDRLGEIAERLKLTDDDLLADKPWRPRGFGVWGLDDGIALGVKVYVSSQRPVDLLLAVPPRFLKSYTLSGGFARGDESFARLCAATFTTLRRAQSVARIAAVHLQDQSWCEPFHEEDRGFLVPSVVATACNWQECSLSRLEGWVSVSLD